MHDGVLSHVRELRAHLASHQGVVGLGKHGCSDGQGLRAGDPLQEGLVVAELELLELQLPGGRVRLVGARHGPPQRPASAVPDVDREQVVRERREDVTPAQRVVARLLIGFLGAGGRRVVGEHVGDADGVEAQEHGLLPPEVAVGAVQRLDVERSHRSEAPEEQKRSTND
jgi:hypothetical protein